MKNQNRSEVINIPETPKNDKKDDVFTDEEVKALEKELIQTYLKTGDHPVKTLFKMYRKYVKEITLSLIFFFLKTLPVIVLPIMTARIINLVTERPDEFFKPLMVNIAVMVFLFVLNIPTHMLHIKYHSLVSRRLKQVFAVLW